MSEQVGLAQSLPCSKAITKLVNNPVILLYPETPATSLRHETLLVSELSTIHQRTLLFFYPEPTFFFPLIRHRFERTMAMYSPTRPRNGSTFNPLDIAKLA